MVLLNLKGVGATTLKKLSMISNFKSASFQELADADPRVKKAIKKIDALDASKAAVDREIALSREHGINVFCFHDKGYPELLNDTFDNPPVIYTKGEWPTDQSRSVAIIGTRNPTPHGEIIAERITQYFARNNWSVVSGLALGCDAIAHRTALNNESHTVAVLAHGFKTIAPSQHKKLAAKILDTGGLLLTEYNYNTAPDPYKFVARDRIQAGLARGVIMIQSKLNGGSLHASRAAVGYDRVLAVPKPTAKDMTDHTDSVLANTALTSNDDLEKMTILNCSDDKLKRLFVLNNSNDYEELSIKLNAINNEKLPVTEKKQLSLF